MEQNQLPAGERPTKKRIRKPKTVPQIDLKRAIEVVNEWVKYDNSITLSIDDNDYLEATIRYGKPAKSR